MEAVNDPRIIALAIGTRPDCLPAEVLELLNQLNKIKPVFVELGLQTIHEERPLLLSGVGTLCLVLMKQL